jgi:thiosulfate/3-mercaptopyruvate sulfurtransferase
MPKLKRAASPLISAAELLARLGAPDLRVVDLRWYLSGKDGREEYQQGHIAGAVFVDLHHDLTAPSGPGRHPVPSPEQFADVMAGAGVGDDTAVVVYDDAAGSIAARLWWLMELYGHPGQCQVLDGGLPAWVAAGGAVDALAPQVARAAFTPRGLKRSVLDKHAVERLRRQEHVVLLDARAPERFRGDLEPVDSRPGHIPGARNAAWAGNTRDGRFLSPAELRKRYQALGLHFRDDEALLYCGSGVTACHDLLALELAGFPRARTHLYEGSWSDWSRDPYRPVELGDPAAAKA